MEDPAKNDGANSVPVRAKKKKRGIIDLLLVLVLIISAGYATYSFLQPDMLEVPEVVPETVAPEQVVTDPPAIPGSNSGQEEKDGKEVQTNEPGNKENTSGDVAEVVTIPAFGNADNGIEGILTEEETTRSTEGQVIPQDLKKACPGLANGSICIPSTKDVIYYHNVGTHTYKGNLNMSIPSTFSAGLLKNTAPVGSAKGTSLFAAHVVYKGGVPGPFYDIPKVRSGADIIVRDMKGRNFLYRVYRTQKVDKDVLPDELYNTDGQAQIALVTCTGTVISGRYQSRAIVWAVPVTS